MKVVIQRVKNAKLTVDSKNICEIGAGIVCFVGFCEGDTDINFDFVAKRITGLRVFEDENGKMNVSIENANADIMLVSNFTLYGDLKDRFRPSFTRAMKSDLAKPLFDKFVECVKSKTKQKVVCGVFGADMQISQTNDGPITLILES